MLKKIPAVLLPLAAFLAASGFANLMPNAQSANSSQPPHIIYILADDLGSGDMSFRGSPIQTPHLDALSTQGRLFERFYVQPQCTPTRAALMTGRYPLRNAMHYGVILPFSEWGLPLNETTMAQELATAGYETAIIGKWHLGHHAEEYLPLQRGFNYHYGNLLGSLDYFKHDMPGQGGHNLQRNGEPVYDKGYVTRLFADDATRLIRSHDPERPLFLYLAFTAPHSPWQAPEESIEPYRHLGKTKSIYAGMVSEMDTAIGKVIAALKETEMINNCLIIFHSDNGGVKAPLIADNGTLRGAKGDTYEGGVIAPMIAVWPGVIPSGTTSDSLVYVGDMLPTLLSIAQAKRTGSLALDGADISKTLVDGSPSERKYVIETSGPHWYWNGVIEDEWKLVIAFDKTSAKRRETPLYELYNLQSDPSETHDLADKYPRRVKRLLKRWNEYDQHTLPSAFDRAQEKGEVPEVWGQF